MDRIDFAILEALQNDARISNKDLASAVGLAPSSCLERVRKLRAEGVIRSFGAEIDPAVLGIGLQAMILVRLNQNANHDALQTMRDHLATMSEVIQFMHVAGPEDFLVHVAVRHVAHLREVGFHGFQQRPEVSRIETALIFEHHRSAAWPRYEPKEA